MRKGNIVYYKGVYYRILSVGKPYVRCSVVAREAYDETLSNLTYSQNHLITREHVRVVKYKTLRIPTRLAKAAIAGEVNKIRHDETKAWRDIHQNPIELVLLQDPDKKIEIVGKVRNVSHKKMQYLHYVRNEVVVEYYAMKKTIYEG